MFYLRKEGNEFFMRTFNVKISSAALLLSFCTGSLFADYKMMAYEPKEPAKVKPTEKVADKRVLVTDLKAIVINGDFNLPPEHVLKTTKGCEFYRISTSMRQKDRNKLKSKLEKKYLGKPVTFETLSQIKKDVEQFYYDNGQALVAVSVPEQEVSGNVIVINVLESKAGTVKMVGNTHFKTDLLMQYVSVEPGDVIYNADVEEDVFFLNQNNFIKADVVYSPGEAPGTTDVTYNIRDERPFKVYAGADDTGFKVTDYYRVFFGFNWGNFLDLGHDVSFQYTASPDFSKFQAFTGYYQLPLPNKNLLVFFGGYSKIVASNDSIVANVNKGQSLQASGRYVYLFYPRGNWLQEVKAGIDFKRTNNDLVVGEIYLSSAYASIFQYMVGYNTSFAWDSQKVEGIVEGFIQPLTFGSSMNSTNYSRLRPGSATRYAYLKGSMKYNWTWKKTGMGINLHSVLQAATGALLPLEQLGLGGFYSVRGYPERAVNVDDGWIVNFEVVSPSTSLVNRKDPHPIDSLKVLGFFDFAIGGLAKTVPGEPGFYGLCGIGPAIRYDYGSYLHIRGDLGIRLPEVPFGSPSSSRYWGYFSVVGAF